jgi:phosphoglycolate phosphatase-like HAD superfamily hydrolase
VSVQPQPSTALAIDLDAFGDIAPLWNAWLEDASRRYRVDGLERLGESDRAGVEATLDERLGNWRPLLERFAEEHAAVYLRPRSDVSAALRKLQGSGVRLGVFTDLPEPLARTVVAQLGAARRVEVVEAGDGALERLRERLGDGALVVHTAAELVAAAE